MHIRISCVPCNWTKSRHCSISVYTMSFNFLTRNIIINISTIIDNQVPSVRQSVTKMLELTNMRLELRHAKRAEGLVYCILVTNTMLILVTSCYLVGFELFCLWFWQNFVIFLIKIQFQNFYTNVIKNAVTQNFA